MRRSGLLLELYDAFQIGVSHASPTDNSRQCWSFVVLWMTMAGESKGSASASELNENKPLLWDWNSSRSEFCRDADAPCYNWLLNLVHLSSGYKSIGATTNNCVDFHRDFSCLIILHFILIPQSLHNHEVAAFCFQDCAPHEIVHSRKSEFDGHNIHCNQQNTYLLSFSLTSLFQCHYTTL